ncbi:NAD-dependent epimerase/dehydratase family protein [Streptomyces sp. CT34]|nr:NAD-dependent epimerase/dehydratase family protein [Streptomyces sp. CT34]
MKIIVTGATGTIGSAVAREPAGRGHAVVHAAGPGPVRVDPAHP